MTTAAAAADSRRRLSGDVLGVGGGLLVLGASSYVFLTITAHQLSPAAFSAFSVLYTLAYALGPGIFLPIEQELGRALAHRRERGEGGGPVIRAAARVSLGAAVVVTLLTLAASEPLADRLFDGSRALQLALLATVLALWLAHVTRGAMAGLGRFANYGTQLGVEGATRVALCLVLVAAGVRTAGGYGWLLPAGILLSVVAGVRHLPEMLAPGPASDVREVAQALSWLLASSVLSQVLVNGGPVAAKVIAARSQSPVAGHLLAAIVLTRVPLFLFGAVQAALLPNLAAQLARGGHAVFLATLRRLLAALAALTAAATAVAAGAGPWLLRAMFGAHFATSSGVLAGLAASTGLYMLAAVTSQSLIALRRYAASALAWLLGAAVFFALLGAHGPVTVRVTLGLVAGSGVAGLTALVLLLRAAGRPSPA